MTMNNIFVKALFTNGYDAISDFLGYNYPENEEKDTTENRILEVIQQMPEDEYKDFFTQNVEGVIAYDIQWDIDMDEAYEKLDDMTAKEASEALGIPYEKYANMSTEERHDYAYDQFRHNRCDLAEFMELPEEIEIPSEIFDDEEVSDWLSDEYGYCHEGFRLKVKE